ncbi:HD domain-containing protein [Bacillus rubiinfantis]|uniref:HD domain-containing protein n=1 Tax=Bacillus rubiinfantis TaxID=1499680 RepID=UPI0005A6A0EB|nr:HD domain-containing protein [Bacillus rubiinfantis]
MNIDIIKQAEEFVRTELGEDATGHDWFHVDRVRQNALFIYNKERTGNPFIIELAALLHDIPDEKLNESAAKGEEKLESFLQSLPLDTVAKNAIKDIIDSISFKGGQTDELPSIEAKIVQDADRLDAIGAIGIARAFAYGGKKGQQIYHPAIQVREVMTREEYRKGKSTSINHFYEKLLKLTSLLNTETARKMAESRQKIVITFLDQFFQEWNGTHNENAHS